MGWFGRKSLKVFIADFEKFSGGKSCDEAVLSTLVTNLLEVPIDISGFDRKRFVSKSEDLKSALFETATRVSRKQARLIATEILDVGVKSQKQTGDEHVFFANGLIASYFQAVAETNSLSGNIKSKSYLKALPLFSRVVDLITEQVSAQRSLKNAH